MSGTQKAQSLPEEKSLVTEDDSIPFEIVNGQYTINRDDLRTTHEEADVIDVQQVIKLEADESIMIDVVCDDTDVFVQPVLLHFSRQENITTNIRMVGTSFNRKVVYIKAILKNTEKSFVPCSLSHTHGHFLTRQRCVSVQSVYSSSVSSYSGVEKLSKSLFVRKK